MIKGVILDLDGTVYRGEEAVPGAADFVLRLKAQGRKCLFVTNRSSRSPTAVRNHLRDLGIPCRASDVLTSAQATGQYLKKGSVFCIGEAGLRQELRKAGLTIADDTADYVVVGLDRHFTYAKMKRACNLILGGAKFIATNPDKRMPLASEVVPGTGAIVAAIAVASGTEPLTIGKPEPLIIELAVARLGLRKKDVIVVGDNLETDVPAGHRAGVRTALLLTGLSKRRDVKRAPIKPTWVASDYKELSRIVESEG